MTVAGALLISARSAAWRDVVECIVELFWPAISGSFAVTLAELKLVPDVPPAIDSRAHVVGDDDRRCRSPARHPRTCRSACRT